MELHGRRKLEGFEIDLAKDLCARAKLTCDISAQNWDGIIPGLVAGKYDAIMAGMSITAKRLETIDFSVPYATARDGFFASSKSGLAKLPGTNTVYDLSRDETAATAVMAEMKPLLKGKVVGVQGSSTMSSFLDKYFKDAVQVREYKTTESAELDLLAGRVDAIVQSNTTLQEDKKNHKFDGYEMYGPTFTGGPFGLGVGIGLRKGDDALKGAFDRAIREAVKDGSLQRLSMKWFDTDVTPLVTGN